MMINKKTITEIPKGYKQTEIGVIPEDWEVKRLDEIFSITAGGDIDKLDFSEFKDEKYQFPIFSNSLTNSGLYGFSSKYQYEGDCITVTARGSLGVAIPRKGKFNAIIRLLVLSPKEKLSTIYISEFINNKINFSVESTGVPQLTAPQISKYRVAFPEFKEQSAIAQVLSDIDALIENLDKLIAKKKAIKQGAMQELLSGKRRLPGFTGKWVRKRLGEVCEILKGQGLSKNKIERDGKYPCILYGELFTRYKEVINRVFSFSNVMEGVVSRKDDVLLPGSTTTIGIDLAKASALTIEGVLLGGDINILRKIKNDYDAIFLAYYLTYIKKDDIAKLTKGITIHHLHGKDLIDLQIQLPSLEEQSAIAQVLSDMDAEIEALEKKRDKYKMIKQGAMQLLLTGKVRLV